MPDLQKLHGAAGTLKENTEASAGSQVQKFRVQSSLDDYSHQDTKTQKRLLTNGVPSCLCAFVAIFPARPGQSLGNKHIKPPRRTCPLTRLEKLPEFGTIFAH
jgi:hypothetical protein